MQPDQIKAALKAWGMAEANRYAYSRGDRTVHVLQLVREHAPGTAERALRDLVGRDGRDRRRFMAERTGVPNLLILPAWAVDPVRASNDADRPHDNPEIAVDQGIPDHLRWVDCLVRLMERQRPIMGACVREEYSTSGSQTVKARRVAEKLRYDGRFTKWMYRAELDRAIIWIEGFQAAA